jgi:predicted acyltransferase (DUF342 family)
MMIHSEKGQAMPLAILVMAIGTLVISPFLSHAGSSLIGSRIYEQGITELYSCDSGIEYAIWSLQSGGLEVAEGNTEILPEFSINNRTVQVSVENQGSQIYLVTATATSEDGHSTTIESYVRSGGGWSNDGDISEDTEGDIYVDGDVNTDGNVTVDGSIYATGNVDLGNNAQVTGDIVAGGNLELSNTAYIGGDVSASGDLILNNNSEIGSLEVGGNVCAAGDIHLENNTTIYGSVYTTGNIAMSGNAIIKDDVHSGDDIAIIIIDNNARIEGNVYITGSVSSKIQLANNACIYEDVYATGTINNIIREGNILGNVYENYTGEYPPHPDCPAIPEPGGGTGIVTWD